MRKTLACCVVALALTISAQSRKPSAAMDEYQRPPTPLVKDATFHSASVGRDMKYRILFPRACAPADRRFTVLYLLHGLSGSYLDWDTKTGLERYVQNIPIIVVMPDADDSWYTNSASDPKDKFEDYVAKDLLAEIDGHYRTIPSRNARAVAGLSMGGYAAIKLALKYPESYMVAGSLSGALNVGSDLDKREQQYRDRILQAFGPEGSPTRSENNVFQLLDKADPQQLPYLYLACGIDDRFLDTNRQFAQQLSERKIAYEFHETPGAHDWDYWDRSLRGLLPVIEDKLSLVTTTPSH